MMGHRKVEQAALFYEFSLDRHVPADHLLRSIDRFVEFGEAIASASARSGGCAMRSISIWHTAGSVALASMAMCLTILRSRRTDMAVSRSCGAASVRNWSAEKVLPSMPA
jgi:hypothetical protein